MVTAWPLAHEHPGDPGATIGRKRRPEAQQGAAQPNTGSPVARASETAQRPLAGIFADA